MTRPWNEEDGNYLIHMRTRAYPCSSDLCLAEAVVELRDGRTFPLTEGNLRDFLWFAVRTTSFEALARKLQELRQPHKIPGTPLAIWHCLRDQKIADTGQV